MDTVLPGARPRYLETRQPQQLCRTNFVRRWKVDGHYVDRSNRPRDRFFFRRLWSARLAGLTVIIVLVIIHERRRSPALLLTCGIDIPPKKGNPAAVQNVHLNLAIPGLDLGYHPMVCMR